MIQNHYLRIFVTGDLHYLPTRRDIYLAFAERLKAEQPDCLVVVGDVGHPVRLFRRALQLFADFTCPRLLIAGNHDVYRGEHDSRVLWEEVLPQVTREEGFIWLEDENVTLPLPSAATTGAVTTQLGICGTMGWYDYSSHAPHLTYSPSDYRTLKHLVNHDADYVNWPWSDLAMARYLSRRFADRLWRLHENAAVGQVLVVTHMPPFAEAIPRHPESDSWSLLSAYLGNFTLGELLRRMPKVTHVVSGHIHRPGQWVVHGNYQMIDFRLVGSQKGRPLATLLQFGD
jgi:hypothetical protein